jgi:hypothetical protein
MIYWSKRDGYTYKDEDTLKEYSLFEMMCYQGTATSDVIAIWDEKNNCFANHVYGATLLYEDIEELNNTIKYYVDAYEAKQKTKAKAKAFTKYEFNKAGIKAFLSKASEDFFEEMDHELEDQDLSKFDIVVSCGKHQIRIPLGAEEWNSVEVMLADCLEVNE